MNVKREMDELELLMNVVFEYCKKKGIKYRLDANFKKAHFVQGFNCDTS